MTGGIGHTPSRTNVCNFSYFLTYIFSNDIEPDMLKLCRVTKVKVLFPVLVYVFNLTYLNFRPPFRIRVYYLPLCGINVISRNGPTIPGMNFDF